MNKERLLTLAYHLRYGKLGHDNFNYNCYNYSIEDITKRPNFCGTDGCAIGECPIVFPNDWRFGTYGTPQLININSYSSEFSGTTYFGLSFENYYFLFENLAEYSPCKRLSSWEANKEEVALHIEKFVSYGGVYPEDYELPENNFGEFYKQIEEKCTSNV